MRRQLSDDTGPMIYLDNNGTTLAPIEVVASVIEWCNCGNPSAAYAAAITSTKMLHDFRKFVAKLCNFSLEDYAVIFTSGASESNSAILRSVAESWRNKFGTVGHIVMCSTEHKSLLECADYLSQNGLARITLVDPDSRGITSADSLAAEFCPETCLVVAMHANNETGALNPIAEIGRIAHAANIPFHCDAVQSFGKHPLQPNKCNVDSFCVSFHKFHGMPGSGLHIIRRALIDGYKLPPLIFGSQNDGYRGGTENLMGIGSGFVALQLCMKDRSRKNAAMLSLKHRLIGQLSAAFPCLRYNVYITMTAPEKQLQGALTLVLLSGADPAEYSANTMLLSVVKFDGPAICNAKIKERLAAENIIVSIGSACNTSAEKASHVLYALRADKWIRRGTLRISWSDYTTTADMDRFVNVFVAILRTC